MEFLDRHLNGKTYVLPLLLIAFTFFLYNYLSFTSSNWVDESTEFEPYYLSKLIYENGGLDLKEPLNENFYYPVFTPGTLYYIGNHLVPMGAWGMVLLMVPGHALGEEGPFLLNSLICVVGILFFYLTVRKLYGVGIATLSTFFLSISVPAIYWSNFLFGNFAALSFLLISLFFLVKIIKDNNQSIWNYVLCALFLSVFVWLRYESIVCLFLSLPILIFHMKNFDKRKLFIGVVVFLLLCSPIPILNNHSYGSPFLIGYSLYDEWKEAPASLSNMEGTGHGLLEMRGVHEIISYLFPSGFLQEYGFIKGLKLWLSNILNCILYIYPIPTLIGFLGLLYLTFKKRMDPFLFSGLLISVYFIYREGIGYHWGWGQGGSITAYYSRYWFIVFALLSVLSSIFLLRYVKKLFSYKVFAYLLSIVIILHGCIAVGTGFALLEDVKQEKSDWYEIECWSRSLPENSIVVSEFFSQIIVSRNVLNPRLIEGMGIYESLPEKIEKPTQEGICVLSRYIKQLANSGYTVYTIEWAKHQGTYLDLPKLLAENNDDLTSEKVQSFKDGDVIVHKIEVAR